MAWNSRGTIHQHHNHNRNNNNNPNNNIDNKPIADAIKSLQITAPAVQSAAKEARNKPQDPTALAAFQKANDDYLKSLGINTLWISPITKNAEGAWGLWTKGVTSKFSGYHGYWPTGLRQVDHRFGKSDDLKQLLNAAHSQDMNVVLDFVAHHVHKDHPLFHQHPDWVTELHLPDGRLNTELWDEHRLTTWFDIFLPTWDFSRPEVREALADSAIFWLKEYDLDGFRHDATKHVPEEFWRKLTARIKSEVDRPVYQIGETYGNPELIGSYVNSGQMDGQFDFNLYDAAVDAFANDNRSFENLSRVLGESLQMSGSGHRIRCRECDNEQYKKECAHGILEQAGKKYECRDPLYDDRRPCECQAKGVREWQID